MSSSTFTPTIAYDSERPPSSPLDAPDLSLLRKKRKRGWELPRNVQTGLTCLCISLSALQSNGVYIWPT